MGIHLEHWNHVADQYHAADNFMSWLQQKYHVGFDMSHAKPGTPQDRHQLLNEFFFIDENAMEKEREEILKRLQERNDACTKGQFIV